MPAPSSQVLRRMLEEQEFKARQPDLVIALDDDEVQKAASFYFTAEEVKVQSMLEIGMECRRLEKEMHRTIALKYPQLKGHNIYIHYDQGSGKVSARVYDKKEGGPDLCPTE